MKIAAFCAAQKAEVGQAKLDTPPRLYPRSFADKLKKAHKQLSNRGVLVGPMQDGRDMWFFEIRNIERHLIQVCEES